MWFVSEMMEEDPGCGWLAAGAGSHNQAFKQFLNEISDTLDLITDISQSTCLSRVRGPYHQYFATVLRQHVHDSLLQS